MSGEPTVTPLDALCVTECVCCGKAMWADLGSLDPICENCDEARQPLLAEIERLKADLAKFHRCEPLVFPKTLPDGGCGYYGSETVHNRTVWHREES